MLRRKTVARIKPGNEANCQQDGAHGERESADGVHSAPSWISCRSCTSPSRAAAAITLLLMLLVLVPGLGIRVNGARRWFSLGPLGSFQPSEVAKLTFAIFMARWVDKRRDRLNSFVHGFLPLLGRPERGTWRGAESAVRASRIGSNN